MQNILILGSGGREHALADIYSKSRKIKRVFVLPGNGLTDYKNTKIKNVTSISPSDINTIISFCKKEKIDLVDVAQDEPISKGFVGLLEKNGIPSFGPTQKASQIEWDKDWARQFMEKYNLPIPTYKSFTNSRQALAYLNKLPNQTLYIKASGLAGGKGAIRAGNRQEAINAIKAMKQFGKAGRTFLIEEALLGEEFSLFAICDGKHYIITKAAQDHKTVYSGDKGLNTGGMGCVAPPLVVTKKIIKDIERKILKPFLQGMKKEGRPYTGILYLGGMLTKKGVKIIEFNARWGDPEAEVILPSFKTDYLTIVLKALEGKLDEINIRFDNKTRVSIAGCSAGYPNDYSEVKDKEIFGLDSLFSLKNISLFGAGIKRQGEKFLADGGRIFHLVAEGNTIQEVRKKAYEAMSLIFIEGNNLHYRTDIAWRDVERLIKEKT
ncbi:MAG: phosphoribosylamine--glycine ligase [Candidatus Levybacteria bacterium]|nr:phosphoribosylamine--glycine ligase [Candidatus Levybacteria bacterium]